MSRTRRRSAASIFAVPMLLGAITLAGLFIALTGDGLRNAASWAALSIPIAVFLSAFARRT